MRRLVLSLCLLLAFVMSAYAGCKINEEAMGITDKDVLITLNRTIRVAGEGSPQAARMFTKGLEDGTIIIIPKGTKIESSEETFLTNCLLITIKGVPVFIPSKYVSCD